MYGIPYERCLCFVFLVILAVLSCCSGFRIDSLTMTDISKRNYSLGLHEQDFMNRIYAAAPSRDADAVPQRHRIRHHHRAVRAQNSHNLKRIRKNRPANPCPKQDISQKAFLANTVVVARTEAVRVRSRTHKYSVIFKVQRKLKYPNNFPIIDDYIQLSFLNESWPQRTQQQRCVSERNPSKLVRANIQQSRDYLLFLNSYGAHNYTPIGSPELIRRHKLPRVVQKVISPNFRIRPPRVMDIEEESISGSNGRKKRLRLICKSRGLPIPTLSWSRNGTIIHPNQRIRITYKKRSSTLVIIEPSKSDQGRYECSARGVMNGKTSSSHYDFRDFSVHSENSEATDRPCDPEMAMHYCFNGGTCHYVMKMQEMYCVCPDGYTGLRCDSKLPSQSSMYPSTPSLYTCKMGLSTRYFC